MTPRSPLRHLQPASMGEVRDRCADIEALPLEDKTAAFCRSLTELCKMFELRIEGGKVVEMLAGDEGRAFSVDDDSHLIFK